MAQTLTAEPPAPAVLTGTPAAEAEQSAYGANSTGDVLKARMPDLVKGAGMAHRGGNTPLTDPVEITTKAHRATLGLRSETWRGYHARADVVKSGFKPDFLKQFGALATALSAPSLGEQLAQFAALLPGGGSDALKSFTAGNMGIGSVSGLVPFNLLAPSRLIYPVYTVYRNKFPRPAGQGVSLIERLALGISGSQTGGEGVLDISIGELVQNGGSFSNWPLNLPPSGSQNFVQLTVPYRFFGITEQLSWLAQFAGQGFEDISALANLIMLQEMMLGEEYQMIAGTSVPLAVPGQPTCTVRSAGSNETAFNTTITAVKVAATNYFGSTAVSVASAGFVVAAGQVVDVTIPAVAGTMTYSVYGYDGTHYYLMAQSVGGIRYTLQGFSALPAIVVPPAADTGTGAPTRMEGVVPTLSGVSASAGIYPAGWGGGYVNNSVGTHLSYNAIYTALKALWNSAGNNPGAFKGDPAECVSSGTDIANLSQDVIAQGDATTYRLFIQQSEVGDIQVGGAVSEFRNPVTRSIMKMVVHPWYTQGVADLLSYQLPQAWTNVANAIEMSVVQDYASIAWPVIDATFRYSIFLYGALVMHAPFYSAHLAGLQNSDTTPYS